MFLILDDSNSLLKKVVFGENLFLFSGLWTSRVYVYYMYIYTIYIISHEISVDSRQNSQFMFTKLRLTGYPPMIITSGQIKIFHQPRCLLK